MHISVYTTQKVMYVCMYVCTYVCTYVCMYPNNASNAIDKELGITKDQIGGFGLTSHLII